MTNYVVLDLEWNQSAIGKSGSVPGLPFEIIEIGAVKLNEKFEIISEFDRIIKPVVYKKLHFRVLEVVHTSVKELRNNGEPFSKAARDFMNFCYPEGEDNNVVFCTWGDADLTQLQKNMKYFRVPNAFPYPLLYYDVQKLYALSEIGEVTAPPPLDKVINDLDIKKCGEFHRAIDDARYTAKVIQKINFDSVKSYVSTDYFRIPRNKEEEIYLIFPDYSKYVSRSFYTKEEMMKDPEVTEMICYRCNRRIRKKIRWFSANQHQYYCLGICPEHGYIRGKIRAKRDMTGEKIFGVKTIKLIDSEEAEALTQKKEELKKHRAEKMRLKQKNRK